MNKCDCYEIEDVMLPCMYTGRLTHQRIEHCLGTKENDLCSCGGDRTKCDFYPNVRKEALTIKDYAHMPQVLIDGKVFVDREIFKRYAINLLEQERKSFDCYSEEEKIGIEAAITIIENIK